MERLLRELIEDMFMGRSGPVFNPIITALVLTLGLLAATPVIYYLDTRRKDASGTAISSCLLFILSAGFAIFIGGVQFILSELLANSAFTEVPQIALAISLTGFFIITATLVFKQSVKIEFAPNLEQKVVGLNTALYAVLWLLSSKAILYNNVLDSLSESDYGYGGEFYGNRIDWAADLSVFALLSLAIAICIIWYRKTSPPAEQLQTTPTDESPIATAAGASD